MCDSAIMELGKESPKYPIEKSKIEHLESICSRFGHTLRIFCMSEFYKSGAMLSCLIMHIRQLTDAAQRHSRELSRRRPGTGGGQQIGRQNLSGS